MLLKQRLICKFLFFILFANSILYAQTNTAGASFLNLATSGHEFFLGASSSLQGLQALNYNPSAIAQAPSKPSYWDSLFSYRFIDNDIIFTHFSLMYKLPSIYGSFATSFSLLYYTGIPNVSAGNVVSSSLKSYSLSAGLSYGVVLPYNIDIGASVKLVQIRLADFDAQALATDISTRKRFLLFNGDTIWFSLAANNLGTKLRLDVESTSLPTRFHSSVSYVMNSNLPYWLTVTFSFHTFYFLSRAYSLGTGIKTNFNITSNSLFYVQSRYIFNQLHLFSVGSGINFHYQSVFVDVLAGVEPVHALGLNFYASLSLQYQLSWQGILDIRTISSGPAEETVPTEAVEQ